MSSAQVLFYIRLLLYTLINVNYQQVSVMYLYTYNAALINFAVGSYLLQICMLSDRCNFTDVDSLSLIGSLIIVSISAYSYR